MELVVCLTKIENLEKVCRFGCEGIIFGSAFSLKYNYTLEELDQINNYCRDHKVKRYLSIDAFISEEDRITLYDYLEFVKKKIRPDGIYFTDLGIIGICKRIGIKAELIYDPDTLITNSLDAKFYIKQGLGVVLARELTFAEICKIVKNNIDCLDIQVFGHLKMSYSKRRFLSNYFKHINKEVDIDDNKGIRIVEESREYSLPIVENRYGTRIYSDFVLLMYRELASLKYLIRRAIVDDEFIDDDIVFDVIKDIRRLNIDNAKYLRDALTSKYPFENFSTGYLYNKTVKKKEDNEKD